MKESFNIHVESMQKSSKLSKNDERKFQHSRGIYRSLQNFPKTMKESFNIHVESMQKSSKLTKNDERKFQHSRGIDAEVFKTFQKWWKKISTFTWNLCSLQNFPKMMKESFNIHVESMQKSSKLSKNYERKFQYSCEIYAFLLNFGSHQSKTIHQQVFLRNILTTSW